MSKLFRIMMAAGLIGVMLGALSGASVWAATPPEPTYGPAIVDGDYSEWDLAEDGSGDFFAEMYNNANPDPNWSGYALLSKLYLRYDCSTETLYALVLAEDNVDIEAYKSEEHWIRIDGNKEVDDTYGDDDPDVPPDFAWVGLSGPPDTQTARGWEASVSLTEVSYTLKVHTQVYEEIGEDHESDQTSGTGDIALEINCMADLVVSKWGPEAVSTTCGSQGEFMWYITVFNQGSTAAENVTVADTLPAGVEYLSDTSGITPDISDNVITWDLWRLDPGTGVYFWVKVEVRSGVQAGTVLTNQVEVSTTSPESDYSNNHAEWSTLVSSDKDSDVWVEKIGPDFVFPGSYMVYTINYGNGDWHCEWPLDVDDAENVTITDIMSNWDENGNMLPNNFSYVSDTSGFPRSGTGTVDDPIVWTVGTLPANNCGSFEVTVYVHEDAPDGLTLSNDAIISSGTEECDATNNDYEVDTPVEGCGSIGDYVWYDFNGDGIQDAGEPGIDDVTVNLYKSDGTSAGSTTTSGGGFYIFEDLEPGDYYVEFVLPTGYVFTTKDNGDDTLDSDADPTTGKTAVTTLDAGETDLTWDAGMHRSSIGDRVWFDKNEDGLQTDPGTGFDDEGFNDVYVYLYEDDGDGVFEPGSDDTQVGMTTTASGTSQTPDGFADGIYDFYMGTLGLGDYWVWVDESTLPSGSWYSTTGGDHQFVDYPGGDDFSFDFGYARKVDLALEKTLDTANYGYGDLVTFSITVTNEGAVDATGVQVIDFQWTTDTIEYHSADNGGSYDDGAKTVIWDLPDVGWGVGNLPAGASATVHITFTVTTDNGSFLNDAEIYACDQEDIDSTPNNGWDGFLEDDIDQDGGSVSPTAITLSSFAARPSAGGAVSPLWLGLAGVTLLAAGSLFWKKRRI